MESMPEEYVDILQPPFFEKSGISKPRKRAIEDGDWLGTFNLWILQSEPVPALLYQQRSWHAGWEPGKLDVSAAGHYESGETLFDGLREAKEELGKIYAKNDIFYLGRKLQVSPDAIGRMRHYVVDICFVVDNSPLESYVLQRDEVEALFVCPLASLLNVHTQNSSFTARGITSTHQDAQITVTKDSFPKNWDNYHLKTVYLAEKFLEGERNLLY